MAREGSHGPNRSVNHLHNCLLARRAPWLDRAGRALVCCSPPRGRRGSEPLKQSLNESQCRRVCLASLGDLVNPPVLSGALQERSPRLPAASGLVGHGPKAPYSFSCSPAAVLALSASPSPFPPVALVEPLAAEALPEGACRRLFVLGAGRSGTSLLAGLFRRTGLFMGAAAYRTREANPLGFYEDREVNAINEDLLAPLLPAPTHGGDRFQPGWDQPSDGQRWLARLPLTCAVESTAETEQRIQALYRQGASCFKDPRFCYTLPIWRRLLDPAEIASTAFLCVFRSPAVVLSSVLREVGSAPYLRHLAISVDQVSDCWSLQYRHVLEQHASEGRWLFVAYEQMFQPSGLDRIEVFTGHAVDRSLPTTELNRSVPLQPAPAQLNELYAELCERAGHPIEPLP